MLTKQQKAARYLLAAQNAKDDFGAFCCFVNPSSADPNDPSKSNFDVGPQHKLLFDGVVQMQTPRTLVIVNLPPRHSKTYTTSISGSAWLLGKYPNTAIMDLSYGESLQIDISTGVRQILTSKRYKQVFGAELVRDTVGEKLLTNGSKLLNASFYSGITGRGARFLFFDDPHKDAIEANNKLRRDKAWSTVVTSALSRMAPDASVMLTQTRWHEDDITGRILEDKDILASFENVVIYVIPAEADQDDDPLGRKIGEPIWPVKHGLRNFDSHYFAMQKSFYKFDPGMYSALYQQRPAPPTGVIFEAQHWQMYDKLPDKKLIHICGSDHAISENTRADYTVFLHWAIDEEWNIYVVDMFRSRGVAPNVAAAKIAEWMRSKKPLIWHAGKDMMTMGLGPLVNLERRATDTFVPLKLMPTHRDKTFQATTLLGWYNRDKIFWPRNAAWMSAARQEFLSFPKAKHDDIVDAAAVMALWLPQSAGAASYDGKEAGQKAEKPLDFNAGLAFGTHRIVRPTASIRAADSKLLKTLRGQYAKQ